MKLDQTGSTLAIVLLVTVLLSALVLALSATALNAREISDRGLELNKARYTARAAFERACVDRLRGRADWSTLGAPDAYAAVAFADGYSYDLGYLGGASADSVRLQVDARRGDESWRMVFTAVRAGFGQPIELRQVEDHPLERWLGERLATP